jgi:ribosomal protein L29
MKMKEIIKLNKEELTKLLKEKRDFLREVAFGIAGSKAKNVKKVYATKKDVARILTQYNSLKLSK